MSTNGIPDNHWLLREGDPDYWREPERHELPRAPRRRIAPMQRLGEVAWEAYARIPEPEEELGEDGAEWESEGTV